MAALVAVALPAAAAPARFFVEGDGQLAIESAHTKERATVRYRGPDGAYDPDALVRLRRVFRSRDGAEIEPPLRLIEVLSRLQRESGVDVLVLQSGYRSPAYNQGIRQKGAKAADGSLHTEGLAADVAFPGAALEPLWQRLRALECCGAGYYGKDGFLHVDTGRPRFWEPATSRVDENLSGGNARLFARTEFDRYAAGETITLGLHALTLPPVRIAAEARLVEDAGVARPVRLAAELPAREGCFEVTGPGARFRAAAAPAATRARLVLETCEPRRERTPAQIETNPIEIR